MEGSLFKGSPVWVSTCVLLVDVKRMVRSTFTPCFGFGVVRGLRGALRGWEAGPLGREATGA